MIINNHLLLVQIIMWELLFHRFIVMDITSLEQGEQMKSKGHLIFDQKLIF